MDHEPAKLVETGYDTLAERYLEWAEEIDDDPRSRFLDDLITRLPPNPTTLDLGCGAGVPSTARLAEVGEVTGVDLSAKQLALARRLVPGARLIRADMLTIGFPPGSFDAVTAFYSILHVPSGQHFAMYQRIAAWLRPGGYFLAALGRGAGDTVEDWQGVPMFFGINDVTTTAPGPAPNWPADRGSGR